MAKDQKRIAVQTPVLKLEVEQEVEIKILSEFKLSTQTSSKMEPATICQVENLENGESYTLIGNKALVSTIMNAYPDASYVGKTFAITKHEKEKGKKYFKFSVFELK